jgi:hypothetical protein
MRTRTHTHETPNFFFSIENKKYGLAFINLPEGQLKVGLYGFEKTATFRR